MEKKLNELIDDNGAFISGDEPAYDVDKISSKKTTDELQPMVIDVPPLWANFGLGYRISGHVDPVRENVIPKNNYYDHDVLDRDEPIELPNIYSINNPNLVNSLKRLISTLNSENNEVDKVAVMCDFIKNLNLKDISPRYKKEIIKLLKEKL